MRFMMLACICAVATGCENRIEPCLQDKLFCAAPDRWESLAERRSTEELMRLQIINWNYYKPPSEAFARVLGRRKEAALDELIPTMRSNGKYQSDLFFMPVVSQVVDNGFAFCRSSYPALILQEIRNEESKKHAQRKFAEVCELHN